MNRTDQEQYLKAGERLDDLQLRGYQIIQNPGRFCFGMDAVLLSAFAKVRRGERALDLGCGNGILPLLLAAKYPGEHYAGLEIQEESAGMAVRSVKLNGLEEKIDMLDQEMAAASTDFVKLNQLVTEKEETEKLLEEKMDRWMYLEDLAAKIAEQ